MNWKLILGIDTSVRRRVAVVTVAVVDGELGSRTRTESRGLGGAADLSDAIREAAAARDLGAVVVVTGPGSYTGLRSGMAAALGVAHARTLPLYGVATLTMVAAAAPRGAQRIRAVSDAGRGGLFVADFRREPSGAQDLAVAVEPHRTELADLRGDDVDVVVCCDPIETIAALPNGLIVAGLDALELALPGALSSVQLAAAGLHAGYVTLPRFAEIKRRV